MEKRRSSSGHLYSKPKRWTRNFCVCGVCEVTSSTQSRKEVTPQRTPGSEGEKRSFISRKQNHRKTSPNDGSECKERNILEIGKLVGGEARLKACSQSLKGKSSGSSKSDIENEKFDRDDDHERNDFSAAAYNGNCSRSNNLVVNRLKEPAKLNRIHDVDNEKNHDGSTGRTLSQKSPGIYGFVGNSLLHENKDYVVSQKTLCAPLELCEDERTAGVKDWQRQERQERRQEDLIREKKSFQLFALRRQQGRSRKNEASINAPSTKSHTSSGNIVMAENASLDSACCNEKDVAARKDAWIDKKPISAKISRWSRVQTAVKIKPSEGRKEKDPATSAEEHLLMIENLKRCGVL